MPPADRTEDNLAGRNAAGERRVILLDEDDVIAAAQVLSWIAYPDRPEHGLTLLEQWYWARRRWRAEPVPALPFALKKKSRLESQLPNFKEKVKEGFRAGHWFQMQCLMNIDTGKHFPISTRMLTENYAASSGKDQGNVSKAIRSKRRPVWHLASATNRSAAFHNGGTLPETLEQMVFDPVWLGNALANAEWYVERAAKMGVFDPQQFYLFRRASF